MDFPLILWQQFLNVTYQLLTNTFILHIEMSLNILINMQNVFPLHKCYRSVTIYKHVLLNCQQNSLLVSDKSKFISKSKLSLKCV